jgi:hypothetical protein
MQIFWMCDGAESADQILKSIEEFEPEKWGSASILVRTSIPRELERIGVYPFQKHVEIAWISLLSQ